ncbi:MAG TPA: xanthine dehydrogenase family protein subunit M [Stellaceae bacterium]|nr:xanthine dehydrogenase family protein subunit M [Stellaceae bacterium]
MKPARFDYHRPASIDEAIAVLARYDGEARILAGGQSLVPMMNFRIATPAALVDINRIAALAHITVEGDIVRVGAMTRQREIEHSPVIKEKLPLLAEAIRLVGHLPTRSRGTVGGSIAHADPAAEIPMVLVALDGEVVAKGPKGERHIAARDLFQDALTTSLSSDEVLTEVRFPVMPANAGCALEEFSRRHGDFALTAIAAVIVRDGDKCTRAQLATGGVEPAPRRQSAAEAILMERGLGEEAIAAAAAKAAEGVEPLSDHHASGDYRRHLTRVLLERAVKRAIGARS